MDKDYFSNGAILPPLQFEPMIPLSSLHSQQELNSITVQSSNSFPNTHWDNNSTEQYTHFNSALSSIVSSPVASNSLNSNSLGLQELIGKLGTICGPYDNSNINNNINSDSTMTSCYTTPLNSPPKLHIPIIDQLGKSNISILGNAVPMNPASFPNHSADPRFTHRAAKLSCLGSRSFNDRTSQAGLNNENLPRVSSSPSLKKIGSPIQNQNLGQLHVEKNCARIERNANCNEESSISEQVPSELSCRKRKAVSRGKGKKNGKSLVGNVVEAEDGSREKISKSTEDKMEESKGSEGDETEKEAKEKEKVVEPPKDYIHVRARRGEATDSHSLAERVRREKISQRMKLLQDLVPGCNKVTGKAVMLDEIINYVQSLQRQVEFLSMKLASVNPRLDFHIDNLLPKDICQLNGSLSQHVPLNGYVENLTQFPTICEDDLQSIVQMGFSQNSNQDLTLHSQTFSVPNSTSYMKIEM